MFTSKQHFYYHHFMNGGGGGGGLHPSITYHYFIFAIYEKMDNFSLQTCWWRLSTSIQRVDVFTSMEVQQQSRQSVWHAHDHKSKLTKIQTSIPYCLCISLIINFFSYAKRLGFSKFVKWTKTRWGIFMVVSSILGTKIGGLWVGSNIMCFGCYFRSF